MAQLLDRYRRISDGKEFAIVRLGELPSNLKSAERGRAILLEAEDGERVESQAAGTKTPLRFEPITD